jgi:hypothetical protein
MRHVFKALFGMFLTPLLVAVGVLILARDLFVIRRNR